MGKYENSICKAVEILIDQAISGLRVDKTILGTVVECVDEGLKKYKIKYQDSTFIAYGQGDQKYREGNQVYVLIPSSEGTKDRLIVGDVSDLGEAYIDAATAEDRMTRIGNNIFTINNTMTLCSYNKADTKGCSGDTLISRFGIDPEDIKMYRQDSQYIMLAATFQTNLSTEQQIGSGDYGIVVTCKFYNEDTKEYYNRKYTINVPTMIGQPYRFINPSRQYNLFEIDGNNFISIESVDVYSQGFPVQKAGAANDITISDFEFWFMQALTEDEIAGTCLHIITPKGSYFKTTDSNTATKELLAEIKIKGSAVKYTNTEEVAYYWFVRDMSVTAAAATYSALAGEGWRCLNQRVNSSSAIGDEDVETNVFVSDSYKKIISLSDCPSSEIKFRCIAVMQEAVVQGTIKIRNQKALYITSLASKNNAYPLRFPFETAYKFQVEATVLNSKGEDISDSGLHYYWGIEPDGGSLQTIEDNDNRLLEHDPNVALNTITYLATVYDTDNSAMLGTAELTFTNGNDQKLYNLVLTNDAQVFKYNEEGVSPTSESIPPKERLTILPISFELYNCKNGQVVAETPEEKIKLFSGRWLWPVEDEEIKGHNTMLSVPYETKTLKQVNYNGILCWELPINNITQLSFNYGIKNDYYIESKSNTIILEITYQNILNVATTNFTFTKEGELGTNGTKYTARVRPQGDEDIQQVFVHNGVFKYWKYEDGQIKIYNHSGRFNIEVWDGSKAVVNNNKGHWEILPRVRTEEYNITILDNNYGTIKSTGKTLHHHASILQGYVSSDDLSSLATDYYGTYATPIVVNTAGSSQNNTYIITGGFDHAVYAVNGRRSGYSNTLPFTIRCFNMETQTEVPLNPWSVHWQVSWESNIGHLGLEAHIEPPEQLEGALDNYIYITVDDAKIIYSVHFYFDRYSMTAMNGWDGTGIEINKEEGYVLAPQLAAGVKNHRDNSFTGIAIGKSFSKSSELRDEVGMFGYKDNIRTIFLDAETGGATFGIPDGDHGCLQIIPSEVTLPSETEKTLHNTVAIGNYGATKPSFDTQTLELKGGWGGQLQLSTASENHLFFGNGLYIYQKKKSDTEEETNAVLSGTIIAKAGKIGGWIIEDNSLVSSDTWEEEGLTSDILEEVGSLGTRKTYKNEIRLDAKVPSIAVKYHNNKIFNLEPQNFYLGSANKRNYIDFTTHERTVDEQTVTSETLVIRSTNASLYSDGGWYIKADGQFLFGPSVEHGIRYVPPTAKSQDGEQVFKKGQVYIKGVDLLGNDPEEVGNNGWRIYANGSFQFGMTSDNCIRYTVKNQKDSEHPDIVTTSGKLAIKSDDISIQSSGWKILNNGAFRFGENDDYSISYTPANIRPDDTEGIKATNGKIYIRGVDLFGNDTASQTGWRIYANGAFCFGNSGSENYIAFSPSSVAPKDAEGVPITKSSLAIHSNNISIESDGWQLRNDGELHIGSNISGVGSHLYYHINNGKLEIKHGDLEGDNWYIRADGNFRFGENRAKHFLDYTPGSETREGALKIKGGSIYGDNFKLFSSGSFQFGNSSVGYLKFTVDDKTAVEQFDGESVSIESTKGKLQLSGDLIGDDWYINRNGTFKLGRTSSIEFKENNVLTINRADLEGDGWRIGRDGTGYFANRKLSIEKNVVSFSGAITAGSSISIGNHNEFFVDSNGDVSIGGNLLISGNFAFNSAKRFYLHKDNPAVWMEYCSRDYWNAKNTKQWWANLWGFFYSDGSAPADTPYMPVFAISSNGRTFSSRHYVGSDKNGWGKFIRDSDTDEPD